MGTQRVVLHEDNALTRLVVEVTGGAGEHVIVKPAATRDADVITHAIDASTDSSHLLDLLSAEAARACAGGPGQQEAFWEQVRIDARVPRWIRGFAALAARTDATQWDAESWAPLAHDYPLANVVPRGKVAVWLRNRVHLSRLWGGSPPRDAECLLAGIDPFIGDDPASAARDALAHLVTYNMLDHVVLAQVEFALTTIVAHIPSLGYRSIEQLLIVARRLHDGVRSGNHDAAHLLLRIVATATIHLNRHEHPNTELHKAVAAHFAVYEQETGLRAGSPWKIGNQLTRFRPDSQSLRVGSTHLDMWRDDAPGMRSWLTWQGAVTEGDYSDPDGTVFPMLTPDVVAVVTSEPHLTGYALQAGSLERAAKNATGPSLIVVRELIRTWASSLDTDALLDDEQAMTSLLWAADAWPATVPVLEAELLVGVTGTSWHGGMLQVAAAVLAGKTTLLQDRASDARTDAVRLLSGFRTLPPILADTAVRELRRQEAEGTVNWDFVHALARAVPVGMIAAMAEDSDEPDALLKSWARQTTDLTAEHWVEVNYSAQIDPRSHHSKSLQEITG